MESLNRLPLPGAICFAYPVNTKSVSVTGTKCQLNCAHCGGHYLKHMTPLTKVSGADNCASWLVSGGCRPDGGVPLQESIDRLTELKQNRRFNMHVGLISKEEIDSLAGIADCVSFDFIGDNKTIEEVLDNGRTVEDYVECYKALSRKVRVMPHICIGLAGGELRGEYKAMELLGELGVEALTFIIFMPTRGTRFAERKPPRIEEAAKLLSDARLKFPNIPLHLGCMRPGGRYREEIDKWSVRIGINTIVNPAPAAVRMAEMLGLTIMRSEECCVL